MKYYRRRYKSRRRYRRKQLWTKKKEFGPRKTFFAKKVAKAVNSLSEKKVFNVATVTLDLITTGALHPLSWPTEGTLSSDRIGNNIFVRYIVVRMRINIGGQALGRIRMVFLRSRDIGGLSTADFPTGNNGDIANFDTSKYVILKQQYITLAQSNSNTNLDTVYRVWRFPIFQNIKIPSDTTEPQANYYLYGWSNDTTAIPSPTVAFTYNITYTDS